MLVRMIHLVPTGNFTKNYFLPIGEHIRGKEMPFFSGNFMFVLNGRFHRLFISSVIRQKGESKKTKHDKFSEKQPFLTL